MSQSNLEILIEAIDHFSKPAKKIAGVCEDMTEQLEQGQKTLRESKGQQASIQSYQKLGKQLCQTAHHMEQAQQETARLGKQLKETKNPSQQLTQAFEQSRRKSKQLKNQYREQKEGLIQLRQGLRGAGLDTKNLGQTQDKLAQKLKQTTTQMERLTQQASQMKVAEAKRNQALQNAANLSLMGAEVRNFGQQTLGMFASTLAQMRTTERTKGELSTLGIDSVGIDLIGKKGEEMSKQLAYLSKADFLTASYDIKSGIASLDDEGVADMTALAATTARATKGDVGQMTSLFASGYGTFKESLYGSLSDKAFGGVFSAALAKSVQQFKTDGSKMQQAIQSMGSGLAASGVSMTEQFTALGMLQQKNEAGVAGTIMKSLGATAASAQARFEKMGLNIETLDEAGNLKSLPDLLEQMQAEFGDEFTTEIGSLIKDGFGSQEAVGFFESLWGQQNAFCKNAKALKEATQQGGAFAEAMAKNRDNTMDARMQKLQQRWDLVLEKIGYALVPALERLIPWLEKGADWLGRFMESNSGITAAMAGTVGILGLLAAAIAPLIVSFGMLASVMAQREVWSKKRTLKKGRASMGAMDLGSDDPDKAGRQKTPKGGTKTKGLGGKLNQAGKLMQGKLGLLGTTLNTRFGVWGKTLKKTGLRRGVDAVDSVEEASSGKKGKRSFKGALKQGGKFLGSKLGLVGALIGGVSLGSTLLDDSLSKTEKIKQASSEGGGLAGGLAGAAAGAAIGSVVPFIGTAIGGFVGGALGAWGGGALGESLARRFADPKATSHQASKTFANKQTTDKPSPTIP